MKTICLTGNPNCGKTTLFNIATNSTLATGNRAGVTVQTKTALCRSDNNIVFADTPGVYNLSPYSPEEKETANFLAKQTVDVVVNVIDSATLGKSLFFTLQLLALQKPTVILLNMADEAKRNGIHIDSNALGKILGVNCFSVSATQMHDDKQLLEFVKQAQVCKNQALHRLAKDHSLHSAQLLQNKVNQIASQVTTKTKVSRARARVYACAYIIDRATTHPLLALPLFAAVMWAMFFVCLQGPSKALSDFVANQLFQTAQKLLCTALAKTNCIWLTELVCDGIVGGVTSALTFLPQIAMLTLCLNLLEQSGYLARVAFVTDGILRPIGLSGQSVVCLTVACGCSVPAMLSTRTIKCPNQRRATISAVPFVPCSAKLAVIGYVSATFFDGNPWVALSLYAICMIAVVVSGILLTSHKDKNQLLALELPPYRLPNLRCMLQQTLSTTKEFVTRVGTTVAIVSVALWALQHFDLSLHQATADTSILATFGKAISVVFAPLGFDECGNGWIYSVATVTGLSAKETILTTLSVLCQDVSSTITPRGAYSFALYNLLTLPCVASICTCVQEQGKFHAAKSLLVQLAIAYVFCLVTYNAGNVLH